MASTYSANLFTSPCCHMFYIYDGTTCICSKCQRPVTSINGGESLTINVKYNSNTQNISYDLVNQFMIKAKRFSTDDTYELCAETCPKCSSRCRYARDPRGDIVYICSNGKCRDVHKEL